MTPKTAPFLAVIGAALWIVPGRMTGLFMASLLRVVGRSFVRLARVCAGGFCLLIMCWLTLPLPADPVEFVRVAEGLTTPEAEVGIELAFRMFSLPAVPQLCANAPKPARLLSRNEAIVLTATRRFPLHALRIQAVDESGRVLPPVPIVPEVEGTSPSLFDLSPEQISDAKLLPARPGRFRFRVRNFCPGPTVETSVPVVITVGADTK